MRASEVWRSTAFRWALTIAGALALQATVMFAFFWWQTVTQAIASVDAGLVADCSRMATMARGELLDVIEDRLHSDLHRVHLVGLFGPGDAVAAGNIAVLPAGLPRDGVAHAVEIRRGDAPNPIEFHTRAVACPVSKGDTLVLGRDIDTFEGYRAMIVRAVGFGAGPAILIALATGALLGTRSQARIRRVRRVTERVIAGELGERLPLLGTHDDLDQLSADVNRMLDRIAALLDQVRHVGNDIAHDLRTPLTRLRAGLERGYEEAHTPEQFQAVSEQALAEADRALAIIAALLRVTEIEQARRRSAFTAVDPGGLLRDVADLYGPVAEQREVRMLLNIQPGPTLFGDRDLLMEAMANLVENAVKFAPLGGTVCLRVGDGSEGETVIEVADNGPGIAVEEREAVFQRFHRADPSRGAGGNGLGLALVRAIAELHGITVEIADAAPGCVIRLRVPASARMSPRSGLARAPDARGPPLNSEGNDISHMSSTQSMRRA